EHAELRGPQVVLQVPRVLRQGVAGETAARFEHADPVSLLGQAQGGHRTAEPRTDHDDVVVVPVLVPGLDRLLLRHVLSSLRTGVFRTEVGGQGTSGGCRPPSGTRPPSGCGTRTSGGCGAGASSGSGTPSSA